ncbi:MAG TPA: class I SAM-dependent methyltransferase [Motilibacteraceae bacterium]|nr:class I SAM-dependent methyltransferase [Motilibacteraceae bacterium]
MSSSASAADPFLELTGERTLPGIAHENYWFRRHEAGYLAAAALLRLRAGDHLLDAGCGEGYGGELLRTRHDVHVVAADYDALAVQHVRRTYPALRTVRTNLVALPFADACFDVVVSLQVVEHLWDQPRFVRECARVLRPGGAIVVSTPNRLTFSPDGTTNLFHTRELDDAELRELVAAVLPDVEVLGLHHGPRLLAWEAEHGPLVQAQLATPPQAWPEALAAFVSDTTSEDFVVTGDDLGGCLDLLALGRGRR